VQSGHYRRPLPSRETRTPASINTPVKAAEVSWFWAFNTESGHLSLPVSQKCRADYGLRLSTGVRLVREWQKFSPAFKDSNLSFKARTPLPSISPSKRS